MQRDHRIRAGRACDSAAARSATRFIPGSGRAQSDVRRPSRELIEEAKDAWAFRPSCGRIRAAPVFRKKASKRIDVTAYAAQISAQLGAHVIKIKPPKDFIEQAEAKKVFEKYKIPTKTLTDRVKHCVQSAFNGKRIVIFSGGEAKETPALLEEVKQLADGGAFGSIMGRNAFQRPKADAVKLLHDVMAIFKNAK